MSRLKNTWAFQHDALNRLTSVVPAFNVPTSLQNLMGCYGYDGFGNRTLAGMTSTDCNGGYPGTATYNTNNQVTFVNQSAPSSVSAPSGFTYDQAGNVLNDGQNKYLYNGVPVDRSSSTGRDGEGRLCAVETFLNGAVITQPHSRSPQPGPPPA